MSRIENVMIEGAFERGVKRKKRETGNIGIIEWGASLMEYKVYDVE